MATIHWGKKNLDNRLPSIMTRLPSMGVKKSRQQTTFYNDKATTHWSNKDLGNKVPSIMPRLPSMGVKKSRQQTTFHYDKDTIHWSNKISTTNYLP